MSEIRQTSSDPEGKEKMSPKGIIVMFSFMIVFGLLIAVPIIMDMLSDDSLPDLDQMMKRHGIITSVYKARVGKVTNSYFTILPSDGEAVLYEFDYRLRDKLEHLKGQQVTVWSVSREMLWGAYSENNIMQVQYQDKMILDYENEYRIRIEQNRENASNFFTNATLIFMIIIIITSIWVIKRAIQRLRKDDKGDNNACS